MNRTFVKMIKSCRKYFIPQIYRSMYSRYLDSSFISLLSVENEKKKCEVKKEINKQYNIPVKWFYSEQYRRLSETLSGFQSQIDCSGQEIDKMPMKQMHYQFHRETEAVLNQQINEELKASYCYLSMASYFGQDNVALPGCESYFMSMHREEHNHALKLLNYIKTRGGRIKLCVINPPAEQQWQGPHQAFQTALDLEISITNELVAVNAIAEKHGDLSVSDFIVTNFIDDQMKSISEMARFVTILSGIGDNALGQFIFDRDLMQTYIPREFSALRKS